MPRRPAVARRALLACALLACALGASAERTVLSRSLEACRAEINAYCTKITPGNGRVVACLYAHQGQLSGRCDLVLFDAAAELQQIMGAMQRVAEVCKPDIEHLCGDVERGEGRIAACLKKNQMALSSPCHDAFENSGIDVN